MSWENPTEQERRISEGLKDGSYEPGPCPEMGSDLGGVLMTIGTIILVVCIGCPAIPIVIFLWLCGM